MSADLLAAWLHELHALEQQAEVMRQCSDRSQKEFLARAEILRHQLDDAKAMVSQITNQIENNEFRRKAREEQVLGREDWLFEQRRRQMEGGAK